MTGDERIDPRKSTWKWYHTTALIAACLVGLLGLAAFGADQAFRKMTGSGMIAFFRDPEAALRRGVLFVIVGEAPETPRRAVLALTQRTVGDSTVKIAELRLVDTLEADSAAAWTGLCIERFKGDSIRVVTGAPLVPTPGDTTRRSLGLRVISAGSVVTELRDCVK